MSPRTPLFQPNEFFKRRFERAPRDMGFIVAVGIIFALTLVMTASFLFMGWTLAEEMQVTTTVENENRPPDWVCDNEDSDSDDSFATSGCDEPKTKEVVVGDIIWDAWVGMVPLALVAVPFGWFFLGVGLHVTSYFAGGKGSFFNTLTITAWGLLPSFASVVLTAAVFYINIQNATLPNDPELFASQAKALFGGAQSLLTTGTILWQGYIWTYGLKHARNLQTGAAAASASAVVFFSLLSALT